MKESIGSVALYNIIIIFIIITFAFLAGTISYSKSFRVNSRIVNALEKYEGYNDKASAEIDKLLVTIGYRQNSITSSSGDCPIKNNVEAEKMFSGYFVYCVYEIPDTNDKYHWGILTYMYIDIPIVSSVLKIPVYSESDSYYRFPKTFPKLDENM